MGDRFEVKMLLERSLPRNVRCQIDSASHRNQGIISGKIVTIRIGRSRRNHDAPHRSVMPSKRRGVAPRLESGRRAWKENLREFMADQRAVQRIQLYSLLPWILLCPKSDLVLD